MRLSDQQNIRTLLSVGLAHTDFLPDELAHCFEEIRHTVHLLKEAFPQYLIQNPPILTSHALLLFLLPLQNMASH